MSVGKAERTGEVDQATATAAVEQVEGEIRAFVRRDLAVFRRARPESGEPVAETTPTQRDLRISE